MTMDSNVQGEKPEGAVQETVSTEQLFKKEDMDKAISEATERVRREMQSKKDREVAEVRRRLSTGDPLKEVIKNLEPEVARDVELATYRVEKESRVRRESEELARQNWDNTVKEFNDSLSLFIQTEGLDPTDKRIDWGKDEDSLLNRQKKVLDSIGKIKKSDAKKAEEKLKEKAKDLVSQERKEAGLETVDLTPGGVSKPLTMEEFARKASTRDGARELIKSGAVNKLWEELYGKK